ncbi:PREDICTED: S-adenosylmethionine mitochondrial carrier protein-like [Branchiostoma belcheri]|uniref:Mitochondrial S-adenosylmethionine carrier protein n=1 Tax=Branchiostoma belcheri TaxID=7741 RepID=A0A6P4ZWC3_BRABE|nr:PREDICTED: S-adenosylmethionine mitochondrial carrier protein-like [Branchiostoma belcheri]
MAAAEDNEMSVVADDMEPSFTKCLVAGGMAGTAVDVTLFPLDTLKTRLQSEAGFWKSGGFRGIYSGLGSAAVGSAPGAAVFFVTYEFVKSLTGSLLPESLAPVSHMIGASAGEVGACIVRVPVEVVKQRAQANPGHSSYSVLRRTVTQEGFRGLYRGYLSTVIREIPFSFVQFPIWEFLKKSWSNRQGKLVDPWQGAVCGAISGGFSAAVTTPLDVAKTRIMLAEAGTETARGSIPSVLKTIWRTDGMRGLFAGVGPRTLWISLGGFIFLGVYDKSKAVMSNFSKDIMT